MEIFVLNDKFEIQAEIDNYISLIWCRRAHDIGAVDIEIEASSKNIELFQIGYFIYRKDTNDICRIDAIEVETDPEEGDKLVIGAIDLKSLANQVSVIGEYKTEITQSGESNIVVANDVKVEEWIREAMKVFTPSDSTVLPKSIYKQFVIDNFSLYDLKGYEDMCILSEGKDLKLSEHINYLCKMSGMRWEITYDYNNKKLKLNLEKGLDKTVNQDKNTRVLFSQTFDNLQSTKLSQAVDKMANVAAVYHNNASIVGDNGVIFSYLTKEEPYGLYRYELPIDGTSVEIPHIQTIADFIKVAEGEGDYKLNDDGTFTKGKGDYNYEPKYTIDEIKSYAEILKGLGLTKLRENRVTQKFESEINFNQFVYRDDYDVSDTVTVQNDYGIQLDARIVEIVETWDETGYSIEPIFEFIGTGGNFGGFAGFGNFENTENNWDLTDCLITEDGYPMMTETENFYLMYEDGYDATALTTEYGIALTNEEGTILTPTALTRSFAMTRSGGNEPVTTALYDVSPTSDISIETIKISELPEAEGIGDACCLPIVQEGETKKIYFDRIRNEIKNDIETAVKNNNNLNIKVFGRPEGTTRYVTISSAESFGDVEINVGYSGKWYFATPGSVPYYQGEDSFAQYGFDGWAWNSDYTKLYLRFTGWRSVSVSCLSSPKSTVIIEDWTTTAPSGITWRTNEFNIKSEIAKKADSSHTHSEYSLASHTHSNKTNYNFTTMVDLGFTNGTYYNVKTFWNKLADTFGNQGVIQFNWDSTKSAYVGTSTNYCYICGGTLIYTCNGARNEWTNFSAIYIPGGGGNSTYNIRCSIREDTTNGKEIWSINEFANKSSLNFKVFGKPEGAARYVTISSAESFGDVEVNVGYSGKWIFATPNEAPFYFGKSGYDQYGFDGWCWSSDGTKLYLRFNGWRSVSVSCLFTTTSEVVISDWTTTAPSGVTFRTDEFNVKAEIDALKNYKQQLIVPIYSADATDQPTDNGACWLQEIVEKEDS